MPDQPDLMTLLQGFLSQQGGQPPMSQPPPMPSAAPSSQGQQQFMDPFQQWRGLLQTTPAAQGMLSNTPAPTFGTQLPNRSTPLWFGGALPQGAAHGTAAPISPQQNSYWPQILALLQNPLQLPQAPGVQPVPSFPPGGQQVPITPGMIPPPTPGTPAGTGTTLPPGISSLPLPQPTPLPGQTLPPGGITTPIPPGPTTPVPTPASTVLTEQKKKALFGAGKRL